MERTKGERNGQWLQTILHRRGQQEKWGGNYPEPRLERWSAECKRETDCLIWMKLEVQKVLVNIIPAYAPQVGSNNDAKDTFWEKLDDMMREIPEEVV